jgi:hypothetical protein
MPGWFEYLMISWFFTAILGIVAAASPWLGDLIRLTLAILAGSLIAVYGYFWIQPRSNVGYQGRKLTAEDKFMEMLILLFIYALLLVPGLLVLGLAWLPYLAVSIPVWLLLMLPGHLEDLRSAAA